MPDILHGFPPVPPPALTDHLRAQLEAQFRCDLRRTEAALRDLPAAGARGFRAQASYHALSHRAAVLREDIAALQADLAGPGCA